MATVDVTVRGAGIFGLSVAWALLQGGARVVVVDPRGVAAGASGGIVGALAPHVPDQWNDKKAFQLDALLAAEAFWSEVEATSGLPPLYARTGRLQPLPDAAAVALAQSRANNARTLWRGAATLEVIESAGGWSPTSPIHRLVHDTLSARIHPKRACDALAAAIRARGAEIVSDAPDAGAVVWATGWEGLSRIARSDGRPSGGGVKGQAVLLRHSAPDGAPQIFVDGLHIVPHGDGTVAIGSTSEREFADPTSTDAACDALVDRAVAALPILHGAPEITRWAGVRPRSRSRAPMLGPWPDRPGHFVANGGFKIGFGVAPGVAAVMSDLILKGKDRIPDGFRVEASL